jgi:TRAP-type C4-dicarboxylate transport system permease small subunit
VQADAEGPGYSSSLIRVMAATLGVLVAALLFAMMALTFVDVIGRYVFNSPLPGAYEIAENLLAICVFAALPLAALRREHVTVSLTDSLFRGAAQVIQQLLVGLFSFLALAGVTWRLWIQAGVLTEHGDRTLFLHLPLGVVAYFMTAMAALTAVIALGLAVRQILARQQR